MIVHHGKSPFTGEEVVVIATGLSRPSRNRKTGPMIQLFSLPSGRSPIEVTKAYRDGETAQHDVCGTCPLAGFRGCYVSVQFSVNQVWKAFRAGAYKTLDVTKLAGKAIRFGSWGEPIVMPLSLVKQLTAKAKTWTAYTHAWREKFAKPYRQYMMASVESPEGKAQANAEGWRTFRIIRDASELLADEVLCPAMVKRERPVTCSTCGLCRGTSTKAKNVAVLSHGSGPAQASLAEVLEELG